MKRVDMASAVAVLGSPESRQLAYEMAVCVCDADGAQSDAEARFLASLRAQLRLGPEAERFAAQADEMAATPIGAPTALAGPRARRRSTMPPSTRPS